MKAIVAVDKNWGIGKDGRLLVHLPGDLNYFKEKTTDQTVIMGRKTLESLPGGKPLPNRETVILTQNWDYRAEDCVVLHSLNDLFVGMQFCLTDEAYVCGGAAVYEQLMPYCSSFLVTKIDTEYPADKHFHNLDDDDAFELVWESDEQEENGVKYRWCEYKHVRPGRRRRDISAKDRPAEETE